jgi:hypothetical protein
MAADNEIITVSQHDKYYNINHSTSKTVMTITIVKVDTKNLRALRKATVTAVWIHNVKVEAMFT